ncbi:MAG: response regulator [Mediterranea sp.]|jgi:CheY-like chemotaxis protein|nr:response regulator [Mediterranea sp.]
MKETVKDSNTTKPLILVAEDDESNFKLINAIIGKQCDVVWARNGQEAVSFFFSEETPSPVAILMDLKMPVMNGLDATRRIREVDGQIPIIVQTAYAFSTDKTNALEAGATEVLVKPITLSVLRKALNKYLPDLEWVYKTE